MHKATIDTSPAESDKKSPPSKNAAVTALLGRAEGATLDELVTTTGWQKHTARAALTGLRKKGCLIERDKVDGTSRFRITRSAEQ